MKYVNNFKSYILNRLNSKDIGLGAKNQILAKLSEYIEPLRVKTTRVDNVLLSLTSSLADIEVPTVEEVNAALQCKSESLIELSEESYSDILENIEYSMDDSATDGLSLVSERGEVYGIFVTEVNGVKALCSSRLYQDRSNLLMWYENGKYKLNSIIHSIDYYVPTFTPSDNVMDKLLIIAARTGSATSSASIFGVTKAIHSKIFGYEYSTIESMLSHLCDHWEVSSDDTIHGMVNAIYQSIVPSGPTGHSMFFFDLISNQSIANTLNTALIDIFDILKSGLTNISNLSAILSKYSNSSNAAIIEFVRNCRESFALGGWYGLVQYYMAFIKAQGSIQDDDGVLHFTDNSKLVPAQFIAGMISGVVESVAYIASTIAAIANPIIGALTGLLTSIIFAPIKAVQYAEQNQTTASIVQENEVGSVLPYCPIAFMQFTADYGKLGEWGQLLYQAVESNKTRYAIPVPGGAIFIGAHDDQVSTLAFEFHPSLNEYPWYELFTDISIQQPAALGEFLQAKIVDLDADALEAFWLNAECSGDYEVKDSNSSVTTDAGDDRLRLAILSNLGAFYTYIFLLVSDDSITTNELKLYRVDYMYGPNINCVGCMLASYLPHQTTYSTWTISCPSWVDLASLPSGSHVTETIQYGYWTTVAGQSGFHFSALDSVDVYSAGSPAQHPLFALTGRKSIGAIETNFSNATYGIVIPKYDKSTFYAWIALAVGAVVIVSACAVLATVAVKRWRMRKRAELTAKTSSAWAKTEKAFSAYDPNDPADRPEYHTQEARNAAYNEYRKTVRTNNLWSAITGGTKYSYAGYWDSDYTSIAAGDASSSLLNSVLLNQPVDSQTGASAVKLSSISDSQVGPTLYDVYTLISGTILRDN